MIASKSIRKAWILGLEISVCIIVGLIASNAMAAQATLAWDPNTESDLAGYRVHYGTSSGSYTVHTDVPDVTTYTVTALTAGQTYYFAVSAYDAAGNESGDRNPASYAVPGVNGAPTTPATPSGASSGLVNTAITFGTSATDPNGDSLQYRYDWGGGVLSNYGAASRTDGRAVAGQYAVKAQARDSLGLESAWSMPRPSPSPRARCLWSRISDGDGVPDNQQEAFPDDPNCSGRMQGERHRRQRRGRPRIEEPWPCTREECAAL